jgi:monoamine oxidase
MGLTRRNFLMRVGQAGGYGAAFATMQSLGLMPMKVAEAQPIQAAAGTGKGVKVVVLGGGPGGLVSAYELKKLGYDVTLLEARSRPGGRVWTGRKGDKVEFTDGTVQTINWAEGNYQNMGAARLPSVHGTILGYCREFKIPLEVEINSSRSSFLQNDKANDGKPVLQRKAINDTRGHVAELLSKSISQGALDQDLTKEDRDRMATFLRIYGPLDKTNKYVGSDRAGYKVLPGAGSQVGVLDPPLEMTTLLDESFWGNMLFEDTWDWQATMMQPVGGLDKIPYAFAKALGPIIKYNSPVTAVKRIGNGVSVTYQQGGVEKSLEATYCIVALPFETLKKVDNDLSPAVKKVVNESRPAGNYKVAWESRRFWEQDYNIYGGLSFLQQGLSPLWYPSGNLMSDTGVFVCGYMEEQGTPFSMMTLEDKFAASKASVEKIHPGHGSELKNPIYVGWRHIKWNEGSWIRSYGGGMAGYEVVTQADGPYYFAGDTVSHTIGWMEGAALSGKRAVQMISDKVKSAKLAGALDGVLSA